MKKYQFIVRTVDGAARPVLAEGEVEGFRTAVAIKRAGESIPDTTKLGEWFHVSIRRIA